MSVRPRHAIEHYGEGVVLGRAAEGKTAGPADPLQDRAHRPGVVGLAVERGAHLAALILGDRRGLPLERQVDLALGDRARAAELVVAPRHRHVRDRRDEVGGVQSGDGDATGDSVLRCLPDVGVAAGPLAHRRPAPVHARPHPQRVGARAGDVVEADGQAAVEPAGGLLAPGDHDAAGDRAGERRHADWLCRPGLAVDLRDEAGARPAAGLVAPAGACRQEEDDS